MFWLYYKETKKRGNRHWLPSQKREKRIMNKQKKETFKTECWNCTGSGNPKDPKGLVHNIRTCKKTECESWQHRNYK